MNKDKLNESGKHVHVNPMVKTCTNTLTAVVNVAITYPLYQAMFRQMRDGVTIREALRQLSSEGWFLLYRGVLPPLCQKAVSLSVMFGGYEEVRPILDSYNVQPTLALLTAAGIAGAAEGVVLTPFERVQTLLQDPFYQKKYKNMRHVMQMLATGHGLTEFFRGLSPILMRNVTTTVLYFKFLDVANKRLPKPETSLGQLFKKFFLGAFIGAFNSSLIYPLHVTKLHMQRVVGVQFQRTFIVMALLVKERGIVNLYSGVTMNYSRAFISWGIITALHDFFRKTIG